MSAMASEITDVSIIYRTIWLGAYQRKHQSSASLAIVRGIHWWPVNSPHKGPLTRKNFPFDDVIMSSTDFIRNKARQDDVAQNSRWNFHEVSRYLIELILSWNAIFILPENWQAIESPLRFHGKRETLNLFARLSDLGEIWPGDFRGFSWTKSYNRSVAYDYDNQLCYHVTC